MSDVLATDAEFQAAWAIERHAGAMLNLPGPLQPAFKDHWRPIQKVARERMERRERELLP